jgi:hypothetical protein
MRDRILPSLALVLFLAAAGSAAQPQVVPQAYPIIDSRCDNASCTQVLIDAANDPTNTLDTTPTAQPAAAPLYWGSSPVCLGGVAVSGCASGGGDVTGVTAGYWLTGGASFGDVPLAVNAAVIQSRVAGSCAAGNYVRAVNADGTVLCGADAAGGSGTVTSVGTGNGLSGGPVTGAGTVDLRLAPAGGLSKTLGAGANELGVAAGGVTSAMVADGTLALGDLAFDTATQAELDAHKTSVDHDGRYFTETELQSAGTLNTAGNPVDWTKLKGVPAGFADGVDANSGGTVTSVGTGTGLLGGPVTAAGTLSVDTNAIQARVTQQCSSGSYLRGINADGSVVCEAASGGFTKLAFSGTSSGQGNAVDGDAGTQAATLAPSGGGSGVTVDYTLSSPAFLDYVKVKYSFTPNGGTNDKLVVQTVHQDGSTTTWGEASGVAAGRVLELWGPGVRDQGTYSMQVTSQAHSPATKVQVTVWSSCCSAPTGSIYELEAFKLGGSVIS